jgi:protein-S-isoprenylcysteine O-methyltransferase Ste14
MPIWIRSLAFLLVVQAAAAVWGPWVLAGTPPLISDGRTAFQWLGLLLTVIGWAAILWCDRDFALRGKGTPAPWDPPRALVTSGFYRFVRNPMYVGVIFAAVGQSIWFWSPAIAAYAAAVAIAVHLRVLTYEEPKLRELFGDSFLNYCARVPRWIPGANLIFSSNHSG